MTARGDRGGARHALLTILPVMAGNPSLPASPRCLWAYSVSWYIPGVRRWRQPSDPVRSLFAQERTRHL